MNDGQRRRIERTQRVVVYMDAQAEVFPDGSKGGVLAARLKELQAQAAELELTHAANANKRRQGTEGRGAARAKLSRMVKLTWDTHKTMARSHPDTKGLFESPSKIKNDRALVTTARDYASTAATLAGHFAELGLTTEFFNDMKAEADSIESHATLQDEGVGANVDTNAALEQTLQQMDEAVESLDTVVTNKFRDDPAKLAAWKSASRLERAPRSKPKGDGNGPPPANG